MSTEGKDRAGAISISSSHLSTMNGRPFNEHTKSKWADEGNDIIETWIWSEKEEEEGERCGQEWGGGVREGDFTRCFRLEQKTLRSLPDPSLLWPMRDQGYRESRLGCELARPWSWIGGRKETARSVQEIEKYFNPTRKRKKIHHEFHRCFKKWGTARMLIYAGFLLEKYKIRKKLNSVHRTDSVASWELS